MPTIHRFDDGDPPRGTLELPVPVLHPWFSRAAGEHLGLDASQTQAVIDVELGRVVETPDGEVLAVGAWVTLIDPRVVECVMHSNAADSLRLAWGAETFAEASNERVLVLRRLTPLPKPLRSADLDALYDDVRRAIRAVRRYHDGDDAPLILKNHQRCALQRAVSALFVNGLDGFSPDGPRRVRISDDGRPLESLTALLHRRHPGWQLPFEHLVVPELDEEDGALLAALGFAIAR